MPRSMFDAVACNFALGQFPYPEASVAECRHTLKSGERKAFAWSDDPSRQRIPGLFREAIAEVGAATTAEVPTGHSTLRFSETDKFLELRREAGLADVKVTGHTTTYRVESVDALWHGGLGMVLTGAAVRGQDKNTQEVIRRAFERRALAYKCPDGLNVPIAFKIGAGRKSD